MSTDSELEAGARLLDRYVIIDRIAAGGMASIYRATDERLDRVVCVKLLRAVVEGSGSTSGGQAYDASYAHFLQEALALSRLAHPNTLKIHDFGYLEETGRPFQVSEFLDGGTLEQYVRANDAIPPLDVLGLLKPIVGALAEAHSHGIIHRDIKPSNIIFARVGDVLIPKVADFGIARSDIRKSGVDEEISVVTLYSPRWAAPEQLASGVQDERTDVYALALVATTMLTGRVMFEGRDVRHTYTERIIGDALITRRLRELGVGGEIARALMHALAASPQRRTASVTAFYDELKVAVREGKNKGRAPMPTFSSITLDVPAHTPGEGTAVEPASVEVSTLGQLLIKVVDVPERLDISFPGAGGPIQARLTTLPGRDRELIVSVKGLNCFVGITGATGRPSPSVRCASDADVDCFLASRELLGRLGLRFGTPSSAGQVFHVHGQEFVIPSNRATLCVALLVGSTREVVVMCLQPYR